MGHGSYIIPDHVPANEFLNIKGLKFSTSRGMALWVHDFLDNFPADSLRYTLAINMPETRDADFSWEDFQAKHNNELADILGNFINRTLTFAQKCFGMKLPARHDLDQLDLQLIEVLKKGRQQVGELLDKFQFKEATKQFMDVARFANKYFNDQEPWRTRKESPDKCETTLNLCLQTVHALAILMNPFLPFTSDKTWKMLNLSGHAQKANWENIGDFVLEEGHSIGTVDILFEKIPDEDIQRETEHLQNLQRQSESTTMQREETILISIDEFKKIELKSAKVLSADRVEGTDKLMRMQIEVGAEKRQLVAGIAQDYSPEELTGKIIIIVANLQPVKIRGVESQGMLLAVSDDDQLALLTTDKSVKSGKSVS
jgi:methionyl-tRNA synthetase